MERRNTLQRDITLKAVQTLHGHYTADEIYAVVEKEHPTISRATVYRNLNILADEGAITKIPVANGADLYDFTVKSHHHLICANCGKILDADADVIPNVKEKVKNDYGFELLSANITFTGLCSDCVNKETLQ